MTSDRPLKRQDKDLKAPRFQLENLTDGHLIYVSTIFKNVFPGSCYFFVYSHSNQQRTTRTYGEEPESKVRHSFEFYLR